MRILGLDIGSTSVKAVEIETAFGRYEILDHHEQQVLAGSDPVDVARALLNGLSKRPDRVGVALGSGQVTFRNLQFPTRDKKAIATSVAFELEDELPFAVEESAFDYSTLPAAGPGVQVHVAATLRKYLGDLLARFQSAELDPDLVTSEAWAYRTYLNKILPPEEQRQAVLLVQIGHERTTLYVHLRGVPIVARELPWGGRDITAAIARRYGVADEQAETAKQEHGFVLTEAQTASATPDQLEFAAPIGEEIDRLILEIRQAEFTAKNSAKESLQRIYLSGGTSLLPGLARHIEERLRIPTQPLRALSSVSTAGVTYTPRNDALFLLATAVALTQVGSEKNAAVNFRRRSFPKQGKAREFHLDNVRGPLLAAGAILVCLVASVVVQSQVLGSRVAAVDGQLEREVRQFFGALSASAARTYLSNPDSLDQRISAELTKVRAQARLSGPNERSPLELLRTISETVPKDVTMDLMRFSAGAAPSKSFAESDAQEVSLAFWLPSQDGAGRLSELLAIRIDGLRMEGPTQVAGPDGKPRWRVTYTGKPKEGGR